MTYPKRLIEVDLPIKRISAHARREKSIGHISSLHIWWARRPLAACRAVICAALWPDPADETCPPAFRKAAAKIILDFAGKIIADTKLANEHCSPENYKAWSKLASQPSTLNSQPTGLRTALLDFIADFANWDNSTVGEYLDTSRALTQAAHEALGGAPGTRPLVVDPFAGGGSIPLEALRVGADAFGSDLNPVPVLLNKVLLEYIPKYGQRLADEVRKGGEWIQNEAKKELARFYPKNTDGATPIAYLWARTIKCEGPSCGAEIPIVRSRWLAKGKDSASFFVISGKTISGKPSVIVEVKTGRPDQTSFAGTVKRGSVTCPVCGFTVSRQRVETVAKQGGLGERMLAVVFVKEGKTGRTFITPSDKDIQAWDATANVSEKNDQHFFGELSNIPDEPLPYLRSIFNVHVYGVTRWSELFNTRQLLGAITFAKLVRRLCDELREKDFEDDFASAVVTMLALAADRQINALNRTCYWNPTGPKMQAGFARQAIPMFWDYCEANPFGGSVGSWESMVKCVSASFEAIDKPPGTGSSVNSSATQHPLPDDSADSIVTDPPYYDAVPYADLSDFFYVWLKRMLSNVHPGLFKGKLSPKELEVVQLAERNPAYAYKTKDNFENLMMKSLAEARRVAKPHSASVVVFAHQSTAGWEAMLTALINAGWIVTASWPIDTEMPTRVRAQNSAVLASSVHLLCRPRENSDGSVRTDEIGDWRDVLQELPRRIHEWMPRLAEEGVVGADAIFACLGPALEIFSRYSRVEKASGETVTLKEYLECVWAAVAKEALTIIFPDADTSAFEEDARLTAMWLWTLNAGNTDATNGESAEDEDSGDESEGSAKKAKTTGFVLEYDAARKIAQGLGAHLEDLGSLVEVSGDQARLLPVGERARHLFGKEEGKVTPARKKKIPQLDLFKVLEQADEGGTTFGETNVERHGATVLDRIHQSMILFAAGRSEAMKRFLVEDGAGRDPRFWRLAQALSALYPSQTEEKRWVDGVLARKKGLGF